MTSIKKLHEVLNQIATAHAADPALDATSMVLRLKKIDPTINRDTLAIAIDTYFSRNQASEKLGSWAQSGFFSSELLQQASRHAISNYRAQFFCGLSHVLEIGTGTAADTAALARVVRRVTSIEVDSTRAELARENLHVQGIDNVTILVGDVAEILASLTPTDFDGLFADPARRTRDGVRVRQGSDYSPSLEFLLNCSIGKVRAIKVSPGLFFDPPSPAWRRQFVGIGDECLEQTLIFGATVTDSSVYLADRGAGWAPPATRPHFPPEPTTLAGYISEAHAVINRSQHLAAFFAERGIAHIAPDVAYGISAEAPPHDLLLESFQIIDTVQFTPSKLHHRLKALGWTNRTELKKRSCTVDLDELRASLRLPPHTHNAPFGTVFLCPWHGVRQAIIAERLSG